MTTLLVIILLWIVVVPAIVLGAAAVRTLRAAPARRGQPPEVEQTPVRDNDRFRRPGTEPAPQEPAERAPERRAVSLRAP